MLLLDGEIQTRLGSEGRAVDREPSRRQDAAGSDRRQEDLVSGPNRLILRPNRRSLG